MPLLTTDQRRRAMTLSYVNAALWAIGNGLVSTTLVIYLVFGRSGSDLAVSLILAAPHFAGLLRLAVPALMARLIRRKTISIVAYLASALVLCVIPLSAVVGVSQGAVATIWALVAAWCVYHLLEYVGTITFSPVTHRSFMASPPRPKAPIPGECSACHIGRCSCCSG